MPLDGSHLRSIIMLPIIKERKYVMWVLLMIIFSQPYHVDTIDILGTYSKKEVCVSEQKRAMTIGTIVKTSFGCVKIVGIKQKP